MVQTIVNIKGKNNDVSGCDIDLAPNIPINLSDVVNNIRNADGIIPRKITYGWLPQVDDPQEIIDEMDRQDAENIKKNQMALQQDPDRIEWSDSQNDQSEDDKEEQQDDDHSKRTR